MFGVYEKFYEIANNNTFGISVSPLMECVGVHGICGKLFVEEYNTWCEDLLYYWRLLLARLHILCIT